MFPGNPHSSTRGRFGGMVCSSLAVLLGLGLAPLPGRAEVGSDRRPLSYITPGPSLEMSLDGSPRFGGEVALAQYSGKSAVGAAVGFVAGRIYFEAQPALVLGDRPHNLVLGFNPGFVIDVTADSPRYGFQATVWANYINNGRSRVWASPLLPFARLQAVAGMGVVFSGGLMLKLPIPVS
jgi:hypothetical protein